MSRPRKKPPASSSASTSASTDQTPTTPTTITLQRHQNLLWLQVAPEQYDRLCADATLQTLLLRVPVPGLLAIRRADRAAVLARLDKLGAVPRFLHR